MLLEIFLALTFGIIIGIITGLLPGIHNNLITSFLVSILPALSFSPISLAVFIVSLSISNIFFEFIPSVYLGCPDADSSLSILPGHRMLLEGRGNEAIKLSSLGCLLSVPCLVVLAPIFILFLPKVYSTLKPIMFFILIFASLYSVLREKNKLKAIFIFLLSGFLGTLVLTNKISNPLLPMLSGLFGASSLIISILKKEKIPKQEISQKITVSKEEIKNSFFSSILASPLCSFLPALGSGQASIIASDLTKTNSRSFMIILGTINSLTMSLSFLTLFLIQKSRTGAASALQTIIPRFSSSILLVILLTILLTSLLCFFLTKRVSKLFARFIEKTNYQVISLITLIFLSLTIILFSGTLGLLIFIISTFVGLVAILLESRRTNLMGCLMLNSIIYYFP